MNIFNKIFEKTGFINKKNEKEKTEKIYINPNERYQHFKNPIIEKKQEKDNTPIRTIYDKTYENKISNLTIHTPKSIEETKIIVENLKRNETSLVNLSNISNEEINATLYFLSGVTYALNGSMNRVQGDLFLFTPKTLQIKKI